MSDDWSEVTLGSVTAWLSGGTPNKATSSFWNGDIPWISANSMYGSRFYDSDLRVTESGLSAGSRLAPTYSVLLLVRGGALHNRLPVGIACRNLAFNQDVKALIADTKNLDPWFLLYWLIGNERFLLDEVVEETGIGAGKLDTKRMQALPMRLPPMAIQQRISHIARSIDDKISLNRRINQTLEDMAQAIFKSWFVDFDPVKAKIAAIEEGRDPLRAAMSAISGKSDFELDTLPPEQSDRIKATAALFPDEMEESELGEIPRGWAIVHLSKMIQIIGGGTPRRSEPDYWGGEYPWFSVKDAPNDGDVWVVDTEEKITNLGLAKSSARLLPVGATIISARGTVGKLALVGKEMAMNQSCYGILGARGIGDYFNYYNLNEAVDELKRNTHGAVFDTITQTTFDTVFCVNPCIGAMRSFDQQVQPLLETIRHNVIQAQSLATLRDTLLPKLLSGELSVNAVSAEAES